MAVDAVGEVELRVATPACWGDLVELFEAPGPRGGRTDPANCWCVVWRDSYRTPDANRAVLKEHVDDGRRPGLLAYRDGRAVGWVSVGPRDDFPALVRSRAYRPDDDADVFLISCFYVHWSERKSGIALRLLDAAIDHARERGAAIIEAYPGDPPDYKGHLDWYLSRGFEPVRTAGKRTVVRLTLDGTRPNG